MEEVLGWMSASVGGLTGFTYSEVKAIFQGDNTGEGA